MKIKKKYSISLPDYEAGFLLSWKHLFYGKKTIRIYSTILILASSILIIDQLSSSFNFTNFLFYLLLLILGLLALQGKLLGSLIAKTRYKKQKEYLSNIELSIDSKGLSASRPGEKSTSDWSSFTTTYSNDEVLVLMKSPLLMVILPRRIFEDKEWEWLFATVSSMLGCREFDEVK